MVGPMSLTGFAWYQGESNTKDQHSVKKYSIQFPSMIRDWFQGFHLIPHSHPSIDENENNEDDGNGDSDSYHSFFGFVQLSTWCYHNGHPEALPLMREAQLSALTTSTPYRKIGYATNADHGAGCDIHPPSKQYCGERLGRSALALQYGHTIHWKSPSYLQATQQQHQQLVSSPTTRMTEVTVTIELQDVSSSKGLYILQRPYNAFDGAFDCSQHALGTCGVPQLLLNDGNGWRNATIELSSETHKSNQVTFRTSVLGYLNEDDEGELDDPPIPPLVGEEDSIIQIRTNSNSSSGSTDTTHRPIVVDVSSISVSATSYGWGGVPMMTLYDAGTKLPVLPWNKTI